MDERESYWIKFHNSIEIGYNLRDGGSNGKLSKEVKDKISLSKIGKKTSQETIEKIRKSMLLKYQTDTALRDKISMAVKKSYLNPLVIEKMRTSATGRPLSEEAKQKCRIAGLKGWENKQKIIILRENSITNP